MQPQPRALSALPCLALHCAPLQVPSDQDIADLLSALNDASTAAPGGLYAAALPAEDAVPQQAQHEQQHKQAGGPEGDAQPAARTQQTGAAEGSSAGKVRAVCATMRTALEQLDPVGGGWVGGAAGWWLDARPFGQAGGWAGGQVSEPPHKYLGLLLHAHPTHSIPSLLQARYLRAILTSHAKCGDLEAALAAVKQAKEEALQVGRHEGRRAGGQNGQV